MDPFTFTSSGDLAQVPQKGEVNSMKSAFGVQGFDSV